jgi:hypothetical protein
MPSQPHILIANFALQLASVSRSYLVTYHTSFRSSIFLCISCHTVSSVYARRLSPNLELIRRCYVSIILDSHRRRRQTTILSLLCSQFMAGPSTFPNTYGSSTIMGSSRGGRSTAIFRGASETVGGEEASEKVARWDYGLVFWRKWLF